jgi:VWFA-related protein
MLLHRSGQQISVEQTQPRTVRNRQEIRDGKMRSTEPILTSTMSVFVVSVFLLCAALSHSCHAQDIGNASSGLSAIECQASNTHVIAITVEVTDKSGHPVTGLEAADFKVFDNKEPQKILSFRAVDAARPPAVPLKVQIIIDAVNSDAGLVAQERDGVSTFLKQNSGKLDYATSIWVLENAGLTRIAGPSQDGTALLTALSGAPSLLRVINRSAGIWGASERTGQATRLLRDIVSPESRTPGRKLVLFLSPGWPMLFNYEPDQRKGVFDDIVNISNGLRESCISLYTLAPSSFGSTLEPSNSGGNFSAYYNFLNGVTKIADAQYADLSLQVLSEHSGGEVLISGNDIKAEINTVLRGAADSYNLVCERAPGGRATEYHAIRITVDKHRVKVHTTDGYYVSGP